MVQKLKALEKIAYEIEHCAECQKNKTGLAVPGEGNVNASIVFIGEAPGKEEAKCGRPFVGRSGRLLRKMIQSIGLMEKDIFITSPVKYLPLTGKPKISDIIHGMTHTQKQIAVIKPKIIVLLGAIACQAFLAKKLAILSHHGQTIDLSENRFFITLHPAAVIRFPKYYSLFRRDFQRLRRLILKT